jgi:PTH1 family peptidyl-tRNA hydrolase
MPVELVIGLGNPGPQYARTRHNAGFEVADELRRRHGRGPWLSRPRCELSALIIGRIVVLARPLSFMNRSGEVAEELMTELEIDPSRLLVVVDDVDLPLGSLRLKASGGPGTHNGLRDICGRVGTGFARLRVGVRGAGEIDDLADYVLAPFEHDELEASGGAIRRAADAVACAVRDGLSPAMNRFNRALDPVRGG